MTAFAGMCGRPWAQRTGDRRRTASLERLISNDHKAQYESSLNERELIILAQQTLDVLLAFGYQRLRRVARAHVRSSPSSPKFWRKHFIAPPSAPKFGGGRHFTASTIERQYYDSYTALSENSGSCLTDCDATDARTLAATLCAQLGT